MHLFIMRKVARTEKNILDDQEKSKLVIKEEYDKIKKFKNKRIINKIMAPISKADKNILLNQCKKIDKVVKNGFIRK